MTHTFIWPLLAIHENGLTVVLNTPADVHAHRRFHGVWADKHRTHYTLYDGDVSTIHYMWIVRDDVGQTVNYSAFIKTYPIAYNLRRAELAARRVHHAAAIGLPIPGTGCSKAGWKMNHTGKKNSGAGARNRNRARAIYEAAEFGIRNNVGNRVIPFEGW